VGSALTPNLRRHFIQVHDSCIGGIGPSLPTSSRPAVKQLLGSDRVDDNRSSIVQARST
jgi:hypothetical protein